jgi:hypothetical protein
MDKMSILNVEYFKNYVHNVYPKVYTSNINIIFIKLKIKKVKIEINMNILFIKLKIKTTYHFITSPHVPH